MNAAYFFVYIAHYRLHDLLQPVSQTHIYPLTLASNTMYSAVRLVYSEQIDHKNSGSAPLTIVPRISERRYPT